MMNFRLWPKRSKSRIRDIYRYSKFIENRMMIFYRYGYRSY